MGKKIRVVIDSGCLLGKKETSILNIKEIPMEFVINGTIYRDYIAARDITMSKFYDAYSKGQVESVKASSADTFYNEFIELIEKGEDIVFISTSSKLSHSFANARAAIAKLSLQYPDARMICYDSRLVGSSLGSLVYYVAKKIYDNTISFEDIEDYLNRLRFGIHQYFITCKNKMTDCDLPIQLLEKNSIYKLSENGDVVLVKKFLTVGGKVRCAKKIINSYVTNTSTIVAAYNSESEKGISLLSKSIKKHHISFTRPSRLTMATLSKYALFNFNIIEERSLTDFLSRKFASGKKSSKY